jgi:hypothetical protein
MNLYHVIRDTQSDVQRIAQDLNSRVSASAKCTEEVSAGNLPSVGYLMSRLPPVARM